MLKWKIKVLGSVSIFCRWMTECDIKESVLYPSEKLILFLLPFDFWGCFNSVQKSDFCIYSEWWIENGKHLQKTMKTLAECDGAVAQVWVSFFYLLIGMFLIAFINSWCHEYCLGFSVSISEKLCFVTLWHRLLWKQLPLCVVANEKWYSCWLFWFCVFYKWLYP